MSHYIKTSLGGLLAVSLLMLSGITVFAQGPPIQTDTAITFGLDGKAARIFSRYQSQPGGSGWQIPVMVPYEITLFTQIGVSLPYIIQGSRQSFGNVGFFLKNVPWIEDGPSQTRRVGWMIHSTGNATQARVIYTSIARRLGFFSDLTITFPGETVGTNIALGYRLLPEVYEVFPAPNLNIYLELKSLLSRNRGYDVALAPGIQWITAPNFLYELSLEFPVLSAQGPQMEWAVLAGIRWIFI